MSRLFVFISMMFNLTFVNAGVFDVFKSKHPQYENDLATCWVAVSPSIPIENRNIKKFRIKHEGENPKTGRRFIMFLHPLANDTRGCIFEKNGAIIDYYGVPR